LAVSMLLLNAGHFAPLPSRPPKFYMLQLIAVLKVSDKV
jgi:hypothetical protein